MADWLSYVYFAVSALVFLASSEARKDERDCEVCIRFVDKVIQTAEAENIERTNEAKLEKLIKRLCADAHGKEEKLCYYIGASDTSATYIVREMTKPISRYLPADRVCAALKTKDAQICDLKLDKTVDWKTVDLKKLRVKELKKILDNWGEACKACTEKTEYVKRIEELKPKYVKEEL